MHRNLLVIELENLPDGMDRALKERAIVIIEDGIIQKDRYANIKLADGVLVIPAERPDCGIINKA